MGFYRGPQIVTNGLVLHLDAANPKSYPGTGTTWRDISGGNSTATITSPVFTTEGRGGFSSGTTNYSVVTQASPTQLTLEAILRVVVTTAFTSYVRYGQIDSALTNKITFRGSNSGNGLQIFVYANTTTIQQLISFNTENISTTKTISLSLDTSGVARLYVNGVLSQSGTITNFVSWQISTTDSFISADYYSTVRVYNRSLSATEVLQNYNGLKSRFI